MASRKPGGKAPTDGPARPTVTELVELAVKHDLAELEVEQGGARIRVVRERGAVAAPAPRVEGAPPAAMPAPAVVEPMVAAHLVKVEAPMVGTFYRASSPEAAPYVQEGDVVKDGQVLCIIEAMKLMNEIEAKVAGRIAQILVDNGQPVEFGQPLFLVDPKA